MEWLANVQQSEWENGMLWARERATAGCSGSFGEVGRAVLVVAGNSGEAGLDGWMDHRQKRWSSTETHSKCNSTAGD
jgi:hypothetical protein